MRTNCCGGEHKPTLTDPGWLLPDLDQTLVHQRPGGARQQRDIAALRFHYGASLLFTMATQAFSTPAKVAPVIPS
jgi:hypothetical protein